MLPERQKIRILDEKTINQIAAGEVIENPASVVKELIENAIDAGSSQIDIETKAGGRQLIRISDNGCGMERDGVFLALERHATSKICTTHDLLHVSTLGFRGEALPSIASISKMTIHTAPFEGSEGTLVHIEGGNIVEWRIGARTPGTTIEVKSLFFNVPVRKNFQKSISADVAEIQKTLIKTALCYPTLGISWKNDEKQQFHLPKQAMELRISALFGDEFFQSLLPIHEKEAGYEIKGFLSPPSFHRPNRTSQYLFINSRPLYSKFVSECVNEGYSTRLPSHRYPSFIFHLELPKEMVDVNVHPQKREVRLKEEERLKKWLIMGVEKALEKRKDLKAEISFDNYEKKEEAGFCFEEARGAYAATTSHLPLTKTIDALHERGFQNSLPIQSECRVLSWVPPYALLQTSEGIKIIDVKAAQSRIFYEHALKNQQNQDIQILLFPISIQLNKSDCALIEERMSLFEEIGIQGRLLSGELFIIDAVPSEFDFDQIPSFIELMLNDLKESKQMKKEKLLVKLSQRIHKKNLSEGETIALYERLNKCSNPLECPQGKKIVLSLTQAFLEKEFGL